MNLKKQRLVMFAPKKIAVLLATVAPFLDHAVAQVTYVSSWSGIGGPQSDLPISGTLTLVFSSDGAVQDGAFAPPQDPNWLTSFDLQLSINNTPGYALDKSELTTFAWQTQTVSPLFPSTLLFSGSSADIGYVFDVQMTGSTGTTLTVNQGGNQYTMNMTSFSAVPEPEEWAAIASSGLLAFAIWHRRSRKAVKA